MVRRRGPDGRLRFLLHLPPDFQPAGRPASPRFAHWRHTNQFANGVQLCAVLHVLRDCNRASGGHLQPALDHRDRFDPLEWVHGGLRARINIHSLAVVAHGRRCGRSSAFPSCLLTHYRVFSSRSVGHRPQCVLDGDLSRCRLGLFAGWTCRRVHVHPGNVEYSAARCNSSLAAHLALGRSARHCIDTSASDDTGTGSARGSPTTHNCPDPAGLLLYLREPAHFLTP